VVGSFPDLFDIHLGLFLDSFFQNEMQIETENEHRNTDLDNPKSMVFRGVKVM
jgi:hypothetical protein